MRTDTPRPIRLKDYRPPAFLVDRIDLDIRLDPQATQVHSRLEVRPNPDAHGRRGSFHADGDEVILKAIAVDGIELSEKAYTHTETGLVLNAAPPGPFVLEITTEINPDANTKLMGLYRSNGVFCTQCEAEGFRRITYFPDRPDILSIYTTRIEAPEETCPVLLGNGNPVSRGKVPDSDGHFAIWHDPHPKPSYLFALVGGDLGCVRDSFITQSGKSVALEIYVEPGKEGRCAYAMEALKRSMRWDERAFGREYDLNVFMIVAVSDFNMGAMENKGLNIFNDKYILADPETATDADFANIEAIIAHEYFHNWTGNRITCRDWFQLCLKEGLTVFRDQEFSADERDRITCRIQDVKHLRLRQFAEDAGPLAHSVRPESYKTIDNFYTATVYEKGAEIIRMLREIVGPDAFRRGMDLYFERHDGDAATVENFVACFEAEAGRSLEPFMQWYRQAGTPHVSANQVFDAETGVLTLTLTQETPPTPGQDSKGPLPMPVRVGFMTEDGAPVAASPVGSNLDADPSGDAVVELTDTEQSFDFAGFDRPPVVSLFRGFSAPVILKQAEPEEHRLIRMAHDTDLFNRWEAGRSVVMQVLTTMAEQASTGEPMALAQGYLNAIKTTLTDEAATPAFKALSLQVPSETELARAMNEIDPVAIHDARQALRRQMAAELKDALETSYEQS
ncbi:MAG: aminopeptidase N, partial [Hyphomicrobiales bacterium]|nr:aminopeptidase N [Hyphomicrobiales bacterium]